MVSPYGALPYQFKITAMNDTGGVVILSRVTISFLSGSDDGSLFADANFQLVAGGEISRDNSGNIYTGLNDDIRATISGNPRGAESSWFDLAITGVQTVGSGGPIKIPPGFGFRINIAGMTAPSGPSLLEIVEGLVEPDDISYGSVTIHKLS